MAKYRLAALRSFVVIFWGAAALAAGPLPPIGRPVICQARLLQGSPSGSIERGTIRVLSEPTLTTLEGREATVQIGGTLISQSKGEVFFGTLLKVTPKKLINDKCEAVLDLEVSEPIKKKGDDIVAVSGNTVRASGLFPLGVPTTIAIRDMGNGTQLWLEVTFEAKEVRRTALPAAGNKLPAAGYKEVPSATAPVKSKRQ